MQHLPWQFLSISGISQLELTQFLTILGSSLTKQLNLKMFKQCVAGAELGSAQPQLVLTFFQKVIKLLTQYFNNQIFLRGLLHSKQTNMLTLNYAERFFD